MKFELSLHVLLGHWLPGFLLLMAVRPVVVASSSPTLVSLMGSETNVAIATLAAIAAAAFVGEFLDSCRDLLEWVWDKKQRVDFDSFAAEPRKSSYFTYYVFNCNIGLALVIWFVTHQMLRFMAIDVLAKSFGLIAFIVFVVNAASLRSEMARKPKASVPSK